MYTVQMFNKKEKLRRLKVRVLNKGGRSKGNIVIRRRGNLSRRLIKLIDFKRSLFMGKAYVKEDIRDKRHNLVLICYPHGFYTYILKPYGLLLDTFIRNLCEDPNIGDSTTIKNIPSGTQIYNISLYPKGIGQLSRSSGCSSILIRKEDQHALIKLKSGELRYMSLQNISVRGVVDQIKIKPLIAGDIRRMGRRPRTRPIAMNPHDSPLGGRTRSGKHINPKGLYTLKKSTKRKCHPYIFRTIREITLRT